MIDVMHRCPFTIGWVAGSLFTIVLVRLLIGGHL